MLNFMKSITFARSSMPGKRSSVIKARVTDELKLALSKRCHELGITESDYIDSLVAVSLLGLDEVVERERKKTVSISGKLHDLWHKVGTKMS